MRDIGTGRTNRTTSDHTPHDVGRPGSQGGHRRAGGDYLAHGAKTPLRRRLQTCHCEYHPGLPQLDHSTTSPPPFSIRTFYSVFNTVFLMCLSCCLLRV